MFITKQITEKLAAEIDRSLKSIDPTVSALLESCLAAETEELPRWALKQIVDNIAVTKQEDCYPCQDTGIAMLFVSVGQNAEFDGSLEAALQKAVRLGYSDARKSIAHPLTRINTHDNTPAVIYYEITNGDGLTIDFLAKGAGSENMSGVRMLTPSKGRVGIVNAVREIVLEAGSNPCPPILLGIGIGGTMDRAAYLSKKALLRPAGTKSEDLAIAALEDEILAAVNELGIGAQGLGGKHTAISCACLVSHTHIGMLPVAVTIQCHSVRHAHIVLRGN